MIAAGSTGSMPATAKLLATIAKLPHGAVVLPGLDTDLDDDAWDADRRQRRRRDAAASAIRNSPCRRCCARIGIARDEVAALGAPQRTAASARVRGDAARRAHRTLARALDDADFPRHADTALESIAVIEAANAEEEALAIAVALREAVEMPDKTAALVTPDRALARRVAGGARALERRGRRFRRRCAARHRGRRVRAARGARPRSTVSRR